MRNENNGMLLNDELEEKQHTSLNIMNNFSYISHKLFCKMNIIQLFSGFVQFFVNFSELLDFW